MDEQTEQLGPAFSDGPYSGFLAPFAEEIIEMHASGMTLIKIAAALNERHNYPVNELGLPQYATASNVRYVLIRHGRWQRPRKKWQPPSNTSDEIVEQLRDALFAEREEIDKAIAALGKIKKTLHAIRPRKTEEN